MTLEQALAISEECDDDNGVVMPSAEARARTDLFGVYAFERRTIEVQWQRMQERRDRDARMVRRRVYGRAA